MVRQRTHGFKESSVIVLANEMDDEIKSTRQWRFGNIHPEDYQKVMDKINNCFFSKKPQLFLQGPETDRATFGNANAFIFGVDRNCYVNEWNKLAAVTTGFGKNDILEKKLLNILIHPDQKESTQ